MPVAQPSSSAPTKKRQAESLPALRAAKQSRPVPSHELPADLGKCIRRDVDLLQKLGWERFVQSRRQRGDFASLKFQHPAQRLLDHYKRRGAPVKLKTSPWSRSQLLQALKRGPHKSCYEHLDFLQEEFVDMIQKQQWVVLPFSSVEHLPGLRLSPPGCVPQRDRRPRWICDYSWSDINTETLPIAATESMQFGHALDRLLREILMADPKLGPVHLMKIDISDGFYRINLNIDDIPKLGVVFPTAPGDEPLVALPLVLPMGWKNSPPIFTTATETIADLANQRLQSHQLAQPHHLDTLAESIPSPIPPHSLLSPALQHPRPTADTAPPVLSPPDSRDPSIPPSDLPLAYVDVFVDDFMALAQGNQNRARVRRILLHAIDEVFRPLDNKDPPTRREPVSIKKLRQGDTSWGTIKLALGWVINTIAATIHLPKHRLERLAEILASIPRHQKRISLRKWHRVLGELRSMSIALPGSRHLFSHMQHALSARTGTRINLNKGVHHALADFKWILNDISSRPTRIAELVPMLSSAEGHHDASGTGAGGVWFPAPHLTPRQGYDHRPLLWRLKWPQDIIDSLVTEDNPTGSISNSDLELAGGLLHLEAICQAFDVRERTLLSKTDNLATLFWERKGSSTTNKVPAYLLRLFGIHQRYHRYVPRHDYQPGLSNPLADDSSRLFHLTNKELLTHFNSTYPQKNTFRLWTPSRRMTSAVISALRKQQCKPESLLVEPKAPQHTGQNGKSSFLSWPSIPYSKPSKTKYLCYKSSANEYVPENLQPTAIQSGLDRLKITYGQLDKRSLVWGPKTHVWTPQAVPTSA